MDSVVAVPGLEPGDRFSPGPWGMDRCSCGHPTCHRMQPGPGIFYEGSGYDPADALLIRAAPDLYEALATLVEWQIKRGPFDEPLGESEQDPEINAAVAALRKARGEAA